MKKSIVNFWKWLHEKPEGRTAYRGIKTFVYSLLAGIAISWAADLDINIKILMGQAILASIGWSVDKGIREKKSVDKK